MIKKIFAMIACVVLLSTSLVFAHSTNQKPEKPWTEWSQKEAEKILSSSPWSQTQTDTDTSEMFFSPTNDPRTTGRGTNPEGRLADGATNQAVNVNFTVRFFSARPVRRALIRLIELKQKPDPQVVEKMHAFADAKSPDSIIVTVSFETKDQRYAGAVMQAMGSAITATLKNQTYLERNGKRLFLEEYVPPGRDGFGARFIFLRNDGETKTPFIDSKSGDVRFFTQFPQRGPKVDRVFKVGDMIYEGELEY
jgi:hypothetical protein